MTPQPPKTLYFFELPVSDISRSISDALRILYYGCSDGIFGVKKNDRVDLEKIHALKINISPNPEASLSNEFEYNLVFYGKSIADSIWDVDCRNRQAELRALTRRVSLNTEKSRLARRILDSLFIKSTPPIYFAKYEENIPADHYVPLEYHRQLCNNFDIYLMRTVPGFPLVRSLFAAQGLDMAKRKYARYTSVDTTPIITYTLEEKSMPAMVYQKSA